MGDLNMPPPTYEAAMGIPENSIARKNEYHSRIPSISPFAPLPNDDIVSAPITAPMLPRSHQPNYTNQTVYVQMPQANEVQRQEPRDNEKGKGKVNTCVAALIMAVVLIYIWIEVAKSTPKKNH